MIFSLRNRVKFKQLHYISGITLSVYIFFHLLNHLFSLIGPEQHLAVMEMLRKVYRNPIIESILLLAVVFQVLTGIRLIFQRQPKIAAEKIQVFSGLYLALFLIAHVAAVITGRSVENLDTNFYYAAAGMNLKPAMLVFIPYYFLSVVAISLHVGAIHYLKTRSKFAYFIAATGIVVAFLIISGFTDCFSWREMPHEYRAFMERIFGS